MTKVTSFKDLIVWQKAMDMTELLYRIVNKLPKEETYTLSDQMRRAAISIPSNIAEGFGRNSKKEYLHFLFIANGSICELETQLLLCVRIQYLTETEIKLFQSVRLKNAVRIQYLTETEIKPILSLLAEIGKIIMTITKKLNTRTTPVP